MRVIKSADEIQKMIGAGDYADKAVNIGFDNISLDVTETDIIAQIEFGMKKSVLIKCPLKPWFLQVIMPQTLMVFRELTVLKTTAFFSLTWVLSVKATSQI
ncbi:Proline dipeptidase [Streptococcus sp. HSISS2]|nr:Proline dipeptidase [Streptococcus sp. HSISS2]